MLRLSLCTAAIVFYRLSREFLRWVPAPTIIIGITRMPSMHKSTQPPSSTNSCHVI